MSQIKHPPFCPHPCHLLFRMRGGVRCSLFSLLRCPPPLPQARPPELIHRSQPHNQACRLAWEGAPFSEEKGGVFTPPPGYCFVTEGRGRAGGLGSSPLPSPRVDGFPAPPPPRLSPPPSSLPTTHGGRAYPGVGVSPPARRRRGGPRRAFPKAQGHPPFPGRGGERGWVRDQ